MLPFLGLHLFILAEDYADDVLLGVLNPKVIRNVVLESLELQIADGVGRYGKYALHMTFKINKGSHLRW